MEKKFDTKYVYRVWLYDGKRDEEMFFTSKETAQSFCEYMNKTSGKEYEIAIMNKWKWEMKIEQ